MKIKMKHLFEFIILVILTLELTGFNSLKSQKRRKNFSSLLEEFKSFEDNLNDNNNNKITVKIKINFFNLF
jgi:hypothetical protein